MPPLPWERSCSGSNPSDFHTPTMSKPNDTSQQLVELEHEWANAMRTRNLEKLDAMVAEDFSVAIAVQGMPLRVTHRAQWLSVMPSYDIQEMTLDDIRVSLYGDIAVVTLLWTQRAFVQGGERSGTFFITDIWRKTDKGWLVTERHSSRPEPATANRPG